MTSRSTRRHGPAVRAALIAAVLAVSGGLTACGGTTTTPPLSAVNGSGETSGPLHSVRFVVHGTAPGTEIVFAVGAGHEYHLDAVPLPWSTTAKAPGGAYLYVSGWSDAHDVQLACDIYIDGKLKTSDFNQNDHPICQTATTVP